MRDWDLLTRMDALDGFVLIWIIDDDDVGSVGHGEIPLSREGAKARRILRGLIYA